MSEASLIRRAVKEGAEVRGAVGNCSALISMYSPAPAGRYGLDTVGLHTVEAGPSSIEFKGKWVLRPHHAPHSRRAMGEMFAKLEQA